MEEEKVLGLDQVETEKHVDPEQVGVRGLICAVLNRAIEDYQGSGVEWIPIKEREKAKKFFLEDDPLAYAVPFTYLWCCKALDLDPKLIRNALDIGPKLRTYKSRGHKRTFRAKGEGLVRKTRRARTPR